MENANINPPKDELDILRDELSALRRSLETQKIVSHNLLHRIMKGDASWLNRLFKYEMFLIFPASVLLFLFIKVAMHTSWLFYGCTMVMFVVDLYWDYHVLRLPPSDFANLSLLDLRRKILRQMRGRKIQMAVEIPLLCLWCVWFFFELFGGSGMFGPAAGAVWAIIVAFGFALGLVVVLFLYRAIDHHTQAILAQIKLLDEED